MKLLAPEDAEPAWRCLTEDRDLPWRWDWLSAMRGRIGDVERVVVGAKAGAVTYLLSREAGYPRFDPVAGGRPSSGAPSTGGDGVAAEPRDDAYPAIACAVPNSYRQGFVGTGVEPVIEMVEQWSRVTEARTVGWLHVEERATPAVHKALIARGYTRYVSGGSCVLHLPEGPDHYLDRLSARRRRRVRAEMRSFQRTGSNVAEEAADSFSAELARLQLDHHRSHGMVGGETDHVLRSHERLLQTFGSSLRLLVARSEGGRPLGFLSFLLDRDVVYPRHLGLAGERPAGSYFNLVYYGLVAALTGSDVRRIEYGPKAYRAKQLRGCTIETLYSYVRSEAAATHTRWAALEEAELAALAGVLGADQ